MFSSLECVIAWAHDVTDVPCGTYLPEGAKSTAGGSYCVVSRDGGELDYPHDAPDVSIQVWSPTEAGAESLANVVAIACKTMPINDRHVNNVGVPSVLRYGREDGGWYVWQVDVTLEVNLLD